MELSGRSAKIMFGGKERSINELSRLFGINRQTLRDRLKKGMTIQEALHYKKYSRRDGIVIVAQDGTEGTIKEWAKALGLHRRSMLHRVEQKWSKKELLLPGKKRRYITAFGKTQTLTEWARETGIERRTLRSRLSRSELPPEVALTAEVDKTKSRKQKKKEAA
jgi:lambda repressor-like predicted transcriptional regulator